MSVTWWLIAAVLAAPLAVLPAGSGPGLMQTKNLAFLLLGAGAVVWTVRNPWLRAFVAWTLAAYLWSGAHAWALMGVLGVLAWALLYQQATTLSESAWRKVRVAIVASALLQVAWMGVQALDHDPIFVPAPTQGGIVPTRLELVGWFGNPMDLALFLGVALPLVVAVHPLLGGIVAGAILLALHTTVGAVAVAVTALWCLWRRTGAWWARGVLGLVVGGVGLAYVLVADPQGAGSRPVIWRQTVPLIAARPLLGWGPNSLDYRVLLLIPRTEQRWNFVFNEWLQAAMEMGISGQQSVTIRVR